MQLRWIAISVVCFSAALLSACGGAPGTALTSRSDASAMSKSAGRYDSSSASKDDKDDCDESEDHDKSSHSMSVMSSKDDDKECKDSDDFYGKSHDSSSKSLKLSSKSYDRDGDKDRDDDDANCKVTICHVPPGNVCNEHTIRVGKPAVRAHIEHGDYLGSCDPQDPPVVVDPPPPLCLPDGGACATGADCCGLFCVASICSSGG